MRSVRERGRFRLLLFEDVPQEVVDSSIPDRLAVPLIEEFAPTWLLISAGFDAHRADPLAGIELTSADYADLALRLQSLMPPRRTVVVLEGGYDFDALAMSTGATL